ncbi:MAG: gamma-glutamyl-gamma-aminobutyrate hydrolase family protein [Planctomycetes bacterium]|nr:gamma-glutamyl-gamma-aminobutyrate hydrolase family protein [Planctomycetota bacterium]
MTTTVAVTLRVVQAQGYAEPREALARDWLAWLEGRGLRPLLVPAAVPDPAAYAAGFGARGLLLSNGNDVGPGAGGVSPAGVDVDPRRDEAERLLLDAALAAGLPTLGVCRGHQLAAALLGGRLAPVEGHVGPHRVRALGALAASAGEGPHDVNSFHRHAVVDPGALEPLARADDGAIEALRHPTRPLWTMQWHPERPGGGGPLTEWIVGAWLGALRGGAA